MINSLISKPIDLLESLVESLEKYEENERRPRVFGKEHSSLKEEGKTGEEASSSTETPVERLKNLSFELLDIGLFQG